MDRKVDELTAESKTDDHSGDRQDVNKVLPALDEFAQIVTEDIPTWFYCLVAPSGAEFPLRGTEISIGRPDGLGKWTPTIDLSTEKYGDTVSRRHVILVRREISWLGQEVPEGTANGTYLNGQRVTPGEPFELHDKDSLRLGWVELTFYRGK